MKVESLHKNSTCACVLSAVLRVEIQTEGEDLEVEKVHERTCKRGQKATY